MMVAASRGESLALLADVGGTNARFALTDGQTTGPVEQLKVGKFRDFVDAARHFLSRQEACPRRAAIAVAAPVVRGKAVVTNSPWTIAVAQLKAEFGFASVILINDFAALAWSLPRLEPDDLLNLGGRLSEPERPRLVLGPGTGLGIATYVPTPHGAYVLEGEGGHATLAANDAIEMEIIDHLRRRFTHVSAERVLSGSGLENLHKALAEIQGIEVPQHTAADIVAQGLGKSCSLCRTTLERFYAMLGSVAGNAALLVGAKGGVFLAGGILPRFADGLPTAIFRDAFEAKGRFRDYLAPIQTAAIVHPAPAFLGLGSVLAKNSAVTGD